MEANMRICSNGSDILELDKCGSDELTIRINDGPWFKLSPDDCHDLLKFIAAFGGDE